MHQFQHLKLNLNFLLYLFLLRHLVLIIQLAILNFLPHLHHQLIRMNYLVFIYPTFRINFIQYWSNYLFSNYFLQLIKNSLFQVKVEMNQLCFFAYLIIINQDQQLQLCFINKLVCKEKMINDKLQLLKYYYCSQLLKYSNILLLNLKLLIWYQRNSQVNNLEANLFYYQNIILKYFLNYFILELTDLKMYFVEKNLQCL